MMTRTSRRGGLTSPSPLRSQRRLRGQMGGGGTLRQDRVPGQRTAFLSLVVLQNVSGLESEPWAPAQCCHWLSRGPQASATPFETPVVPPTHTHRQGHCTEGAESPSLPCQSPPPAPPLAGAVWGPHLYAGARAGVRWLRAPVRGVLTCRSRRMCRQACARTDARVHRARARE